MLCPASPSAACCPCAPPRPQHSKASGSELQWQRALAHASVLAVVRVRVRVRVRVTVCSNHRGVERCELANGMCAPALRVHHRASRSRITDGFVREGSAADLDKPHVVGTLPTAFSNMMFLVQRVDTPDPVRPLLSSGNDSSKFRCAELRDLWYLKPSLSTTSY